MKRILLVEDDMLLNKTLSYNLLLDGYEVAAVHSCASARALMKERFDLALLDINLPDGSGLALCAEWKALQSDLYVVFLTADDQESDQLRGYEAGCFDYITKPFSIAILSRKIKAIFESVSRHLPEEEVYDDGFLRINFSEQAASLDGRTLEFTPKEYRTLLLFIKNPRRILTKRQLLEKLWDVDGDFVDEHTLTTIICRIRKKIETDARKYIKTAYGMGYQWIGGDKT